MKELITCLSLYLNKTHITIKRQISRVFQSVIYALSLFLICSMSNHRDKILNFSNNLLNYIWMVP